MEIILFILIRSLDNEILDFCFSFEDIISRLIILDVQQKQFVIKITEKKQVRETRNQIALKILKNFVPKQQEYKIKINIFYGIKNQTFWKHI